MVEQTVRNRSKVILEELNDQDIGKILDAGCGSGAYLHLLSMYGSMVFGIDVNKTFLHQARAGITGGIIHLACMSLDAIGLQDGMFDFIICIETLEHVRKTERTIEELRRLLKLGGRILITVPYKWFPFETHGVRFGSRVVSSPFGLGFPLLPLFPEYLRKRFATANVFSANQLRRMLERNRFQVTRTCYLMPGFDIFEAKTKWKFLVIILRYVSGLLYRTFNKIWGATLVVVGQAI